MRRRDVLLICYLALCASMLVWPGFAWIGNRVEPFVFGLPFALFWNVAWAVLTCLVLLIYDRAVAREE